MALARRVAPAHVLSAVLAVKGSAMGFEIAVMLLSAARVTGSVSIGLLVLFCGIGVACTLVAVLAVRDLDAPSAHVRVRPSRSISSA